MSIELGPHGPPSRLRPAGRMAPAAVSLFVALLIGSGAFGFAARFHARRAQDPKRALAERGGANAQFKVGHGYWMGRNEDAEARRWFRLAADQGHAEAQFYLGETFRLGRGGRRDAGEAARSYRRAAEQGHVAAQFQLGTLYLGRATGPGSGEAIKWYRLAAEQGHVAAQYNLGYMLAEGRGVPRDHTEAARWYRRAAGQGDAAAQVSLGFLYAEQVLTGDLGSADPSATGLSDGGEPGREVRLTAGQAPTEERFYRGAMYRFRSAAELGHAVAQFYIGRMYELGLAVPRDEPEANRWYRRAAAQGNPDALLALRIMAAAGRGTGPILRP